MKEVTAIVVQVEDTRPLVELAQAINQAHRECEDAGTLHLQYALESGRLLNMVKQRLKHGEWGKWLATHVAFTERRAQQYMELDRHRPELANANSCSDLSIAAALRHVRANGDVSPPAPSEPEPSSGFLPPSSNGSSPHRKSRDAKAPDAPPTREETQSVADRWKDVPPTPPAPAPAKPTQDALGNPLPDLLKDVFADATLGQARDLVQGWLGQFRYDATMRAVAARIRFLPFLRTGQLLEQFKAAEEALEVALETIEAGRPYAVCPVCAGYGCENCRKAGYVPSWRLEELKREGNA